MSLKLRLQIVNHIFLFLIKIDCKTQDIEVHFTFTKEKFEPSRTHPSSKSEDGV